MPREMLQGAHDSSVVEALHRISNELCRLGVVITVCALADNRIVWVRPYVRHRRKVEIEAKRRHIICYGVCVLICRFVSVVLVIVHGAYICGSDSIHQAVYYAALLVGRHK